MIPLLLSLTGRLLALAPEVLLRAACAVLGEAVLWLAPRRRRVLRSNLHHAFPDRPRAWRRATARASSRRFVETLLLSLAAPYLSTARMRRIAVLDDSILTLARDAAARPRPVVLATFHMALWETQTWLKALCPEPTPPIGVLFRPIDNPGVDAFVRRTRERHGIQLLSRREGFSQAIKILRANGWVGILVDQNAGMNGALTLLKDRVCSTTELPGILAEKFGCEVHTFYPRRLGFWRVRFESQRVPGCGTAAQTNVALNRWLEGALADDTLCPSWLWAHDRWRHQDVPERRLRLWSHRNILPEDLAHRGLARLPRRTRFWVRMPNWLGDVVMAAPLVRAMRTSRPDAEFTLVAKPAFAGLLESWGVADRVHPLPDRGMGYFPHFLSLRARYPDAWFLFTNSVRGDIEATLSGCRQRFGIARPGRGRPLLTHRFRLGADYDEGQHHQVELWETFLRAFGLEGDLDLSPLATHSPGPSAPIGLIVGSENTPAKRWPVAHWRTLITSLPSERFVLFGTAGDQPLTAQVAAGFDPSRVEDRAGRTSLPAFAAGLSECRLLVTNDTGGMHLANALGVPLVGLFGPTNPVRTGPIFRAPYRILQPPGCPPTGGADLALLAPEAVVEAMGNLQTPTP